MTGGQEGNAMSVVKASLFAGIVFSLLEAILRYPAFPLYGLPGVLAIFPRNLILFPAVGLSGGCVASILRRAGRRPARGGHGVALALLILVPAYIFLFARIEGTGWIYPYIKSPMRIAALVALPELLLLAPLAIAIRRGGARRFVGISIAAFFFLNAGYRWVAPGGILRLEPIAVARFGAVVVGHGLLFFLASRVASPLWLDARGAFRGVRLLIFLGVAAAVAAVPAIEASRSMPAAGPMAAGRPNVLLVVLDTARRDHFSCYGYGRATTPFLESFARDATLYTHARSPAPWTMPAHASIFTGLYPSAHGLTWKNLSLEERRLTLAELFAANGYETVGVCNNAWVNPDNGLAQGFGTYLEMWRETVLSPTLAHRVEWFLRRFAGRNDHGALRSRDWIVDWLDHRHRVGRPFFLFLNLMECHLGDDAPDADHDRFLRAGYSPRVKTILSGDHCSFLTGRISLSEAEWGDFRDIYDGDLRYLDGVLASLFGAFESRGMLDDTIVVITADHGEHLGEHGMIDHQLSLYEPLLQVPLILRAPGGLVPPGRVEEPVQTVDIFPTLVELAGLRGAPPEGLQGESLVGGAAGHRLMISEYEPPEAVIRGFLAVHPGETGILRYDRALKAVTLDSLKYIWSSDGDSKLYDLAKDPGETDDIGARRPDAVDGMAARLDAWLASFEIAKPKRSSRALDSETRQRLKALGYVQ